MSKALILDAGDVLVYAIRGHWNLPLNYTNYPNVFKDGLKSKAEIDANARYGFIMREDVPVDGERDECIRRLLYLSAMNIELGWGLTEAQLHELAEDFTYNPARYGWYEDALPALLKLHGKYRLAVLSDAMPSLERFVKLWDEQRLFETVVISTLIGSAKPDPANYHEVLRRLDCNAKDAIFVDNRPSNLEAAKRCGLRAIQMLRPGVKDEPWAGEIVHSLKELQEKLMTED